MCSQNVASLARKADLRSISGGLWSFAQGSPCFSERLNLFVWKWILGRYLFFSGQEGILHKLSHISLIKKHGIVHPIMVCKLTHPIHCSELILGEGYLHLVMLSEISTHGFNHVPHLDWEIHLSK